jgi:hypothetical protein
MNEQERKAYEEFCTNHGLLPLDDGWGLDIRQAFEAGLAFGKNCGGAHEGTIQMPKDDDINPMHAFGQGRGD